MTAAYTDDPSLVSGCPDCLELVAEDLDEDNEHWANCLHCQQEISAQNGVDRAAAEGRTGGRPPALSSEKMEAVRSFLENGGAVSAAARTFRVSRPTVRAVRDGIYNGQHRNA